MNRHFPEPRARPKVNRRYASTSRMSPSLAKDPGFTTDPDILLRPLNHRNMYQIPQHQVARWPWQGLYRHRGIICSDCH